MKSTACLSVLIYSAFAIPSALAQLEGQQSETTKKPHAPGAQVAGPDQVGNRIELDAVQQMGPSRFEFLEPYTAWKQRVQESIGLSFGLDYQFVAMAGTDPPGAAGAASGVARLYAQWELVGRGTGHAGALVLKGEHRHRYASLAASEYSFDYGYAGLFAPPFNNEGLLLTNFYWIQHALEKRLVILVGYLDTTDFLDVYALVSPWLHFSNFAFSTGSATIAVPDQGFGLAVGGWLSDNVYILASLADLNADPAKPWKTFESFFTKGQYFKSIELGLTTGRDRAYFDNLHATFWHASESQEGSVPDGWGIVGSATYMFLDQLLPFVRGGYAKDAGSLLTGSVSTGLGWQWVPNQDLIGFAFNWGRPNPTTFAPDLRDQYAMELFYRLQAANQLAITADVQLLINPALDPTAKVGWIFGVRTRLAL